MKLFFKRYYPILFAMLAIIYVLVIRSMPKPPIDDGSVNVLDAATGIITSMPREEYLIGVVAAEMPAAFHEEALKAQAVAARTYLVHLKGKHGNADVCTDSTHCQAYTKLSHMRTTWGDRYDANVQKITAAVMATEGIIATYKGQPIQALFHACSGGQTEDSELAFTTYLPYLRSVVSPGEESFSRFSSTVRLNSGEAIAKIRSLMTDIKLGGAVTGQIAVASTTSSGRVTSILIGETIVSGRIARQMFGLNSTMFDISFSNGDIIFSVKGHGHGVGLSQAGADAMANQGAAFDTILRHYYTGIELSSL